MVLNSLAISKLNLNKFINGFIKPAKAKKIRSSLFKAKASISYTYRPLASPKFRLNKKKKFKSFSFSNKLANKKSFGQNFFLLLRRLILNYFLLYLHNNARYGSKHGASYGWDYLSFGQNFFYIGVTHLLSRPFFYHLASFFSFITSYLSNLTVLKVNFFLISNNHINAAFLTNYIVKRLRQGYRLMELINPLRRELSRLKRSTFSRFRRLIQLAKRPGGSLRINHISVFSKVLAYLFKIYKHNIKSVFLVLKTFISYDIFFTHFALAKTFFKNNFNNFFTYPLRLRYLGLAYNLLNRQSHILFFYKVAKANLYSFYLFSPLFFKQSRALMAYPDYYFFLREMFDSFFCNFSFLEGVGSFSFASQSLSTYPLYKAVNVGLSGFLRYLRFNMFKFALNSYYNSLKINRKKLRNFNFSPSYGLLGFKFHLKGRFTRKQIAASHVFRSGPLPLSMVYANIDYSFATLPLKNSAVGVKI